MERVDYESLIIQDLINLNSSHSLDISPWYQRRSVWSTPQKAYLINTIFEKKPVPSIYIRHQIDIDNERSIKEVVDGQQRIRTILSYKADTFPARHPHHRQKLRFSELTKAEKESFLSTALSVGYLIGADDQDVVEIFGRINSISKTLNPQEKRNSQYSGEFKQFCLRNASERLPFWRSTGIFTATDISRMAEVQFISDLVINMIEGLRDFDSKTIDRYYKNYDDEFKAEAEIARRLEFVFSVLIRLSSEDFADTVFKQDQIAFSLMMVIDNLSYSNIERIHEAIRDIDSIIAASKDLDASSQADNLIFQGFAGGNLHRIRARQIRDRVIRERLE